MVYEQVALETCLKVIFARMPRVRPNVIVIDKSWTSYDVISNVIDQDHESWIVANGERSQTHCRVTPNEQNSVNFIVSIPC